MCFWPNFYFTYEGRWISKFPCFVEIPKHQPSGEIHRVENVRVPGNVVTVLSGLCTTTTRYMSGKLMTVLSLFVHCEVCAVIRFHTLNWLVTEIHQQLLAVYRETCMLIQMVHCWMKPRMYMLKSQTYTEK